MNRPKYPRGSKDLSFEEFMCAESNYFKDIEKYCDELELKNLKLEKALDSTISLLANEFSACAYPAKDGCDKENCAKCWKEWLMKDE